MAVPEVTTPPKANTARRGALIGLLFAAVGCWAVNALVFHSDLYLLMLEPDSSAGILERVFRDERARPKEGARQVLMLGDSRMAAFLPWLSDRLTAGTSYVFARASAPGSTPRCWHYLLRDLDPSTRQYAAIVFGVESFDDFDTHEVMASRLQDLHMLAGRLRLSDLAVFPWSYPTWSGRWQAARGILFRGVVFQRDFQELLLDPVGRFQKAQESRRDSAHWAYSYTGDPDNLAGLKVDWAAHKVEMPPGTSDRLRRLVQDAFFWDPPQTGLYSAYRRLWLGRIVQRYRGSPTRLIFARLPRGPVPPPVLPSPKGAAIRELASSPHVLLVHEQALEFLERPEYFRDPYHLNGPGGEQLTRTLVRLTLEILGQRVPASVGG